MAGLLSKDTMSALKGKKSLIECGKPHPGYVKPNVNAQGLQAFLTSCASSPADPWDFGPFYNLAKTSKAVKGNELAQRAGYMESYIDKVSPTGEVDGSIMKPLLISMAKEGVFASQSKSFWCGVEKQDPKGLEFWSNLVIDKHLTLFNHLRRLSQNIDKRRQCFKFTEEASQAAIMRVMEQIESTGIMSEVEGEGDPDTDEVEALVVSGALDVVEDEGDDAATALALCPLTTVEETPMPKTKKVVTTSSKGPFHITMVEKVAAFEIEHTSKFQSALEATTLVTPVKPEKPAMLPAKKGEHKKIVKSMKAVKCKDVERHLRHKSLGMMHLTLGSSKTYFTADNSQPHLICEVSSKQSAQHTSMCIEIFQQCAAKNLSKIQCKALKDKLLAAQVTEEKGAADSKDAAD